MTQRDFSLVFKLFLRSARLQQKRASLTIASIAWGTVTILLLLAFGEGLKQQFTRNESAMGENLAIHWPGETSKVWKGLGEGRPIRPRIDDIAVLRERVPECDAIWGEMRNFRTALTYGRKTVSAAVTGTSWMYGEHRRHYAQAGGRFLDVRDEEEKRRVIFLGNELAEQIFGKENPVGKTLLVNNSPFTVIGVMQNKTQTSSYGSPDRHHAVIPITTYKALFGKDQLWVLVLHTRRPEDMDSALARANEVMAARYGYDPTDKHVWAIWNTVEGQQMLIKVMLGMEIFFGIIGALTLVIGAVGVANIMYAVVKERTREIGVQMALGARRRWITGPFILEGLVYTFIGGLAGAVIAIVIVTLLGFIPSDGLRVMEFMGKPTLSWPIGATTVLILGTAGLLAGYFPARRAASIDPASTLRYE